MAIIITHFKIEKKKNLDKSWLINKIFNNIIFINIIVLFIIIIIIFN